MYSKHLRYTNYHVAPPHKTMKCSQPIHDIFECRRRIYPEISVASVMSVAICYSEVTSLSQLSLLCKVQCYHRAARMRCWHSLINVSRREIHSSVLIGGHLLLELDVRYQ